MTTSAMTPGPTRASDVLSREQMRALTRRSNLRGFWALGSTWGVIFGTFAALAVWPHPLTFLLAVVILGGRQLALAILMHEAAHRTLFEGRFLNDVVTDWLAAKPIGNDVAKYRKHHLRHHLHTGTDADPDIGLARPFPVSTGSFVRKCARDLLGPTGLKRIVGQILMGLELVEYTVSTEVIRRPRGDRSIGELLGALAKNTFGFAATNLALAGGLALSGHLWVYWAWVVANLTVFNLFIRIRSLAEHACTEASSNPFRNTRTTRAGLLARATVAPLRVNYHLEHHLLVGVPFFRLPTMHRLLRERGAISPPPSYLWVVQEVTRSRPTNDPSVQ